MLQARCSSMSASAAGAPSCLEDLDIPLVVAARPCRESGRGRDARRCCRGGRSRRPGCCGGGRRNHGPGPLSVVLGTSGVVLAATDQFLTDPRGTRPRVLPCRAGALDGHGRDALGRGIARLVSRHARSRTSTTTRMLGEAEGVRARMRRADLPAVSRRRADPARGSRTRAARSADCRSHTVAARSRGPCSRASPSRCAIASIRSPTRRSRTTRGSRLGWRVEKPPLAADRCERTRAPARDHGHRPGIGLRRSPSRRCRRWRVRDLDQASAACVRVTEVVDPVADWIEPYREARSRFRDYYPALRSVV